MRKSKPRVTFTDAAEDDLRRSSLFLLLQGGRRPYQRIQEIRREARRIANNPKLYPVDWKHPISLLEFRRKNVGQFSIIYTYFEPTASTPGGLVSVRAIHHGALQDIRLGVEESGAERHRPSSLILREGRS